MSARRPVIHVPDALLPLPENFCGQAKRPDHAAAGTLTGFSVFVLVSATRDRPRSPVRRMHRIEIRIEWFGNVRGDRLAGRAAAPAQTPEATAFSIIAGVDPRAGLHAPSASLW